ncbi:MAG: proton-conducting membrane transporter [Oscillospiraceae bacterium]|nr:proton-conducting membrane transporter [Oscillospiraceae bacterium]
MSQILILATILLPIIGGIVIASLPIKKRETGLVVTQVIVLITSVLVFCLLSRGTTQVYHLVHFVNDLSISFRVDGIGLIFAGLIAILWPLAILYAYEYMQHFQYERFFFMFYTMTYGITLGLCFAADIVTMYFFYELLTLATVPLVFFALNRESILAARKYLYYSIGGAAFALMSMVFIYIYGNSCQFTFGGVLSSSAIENHGDLLLWVYLFSFMGFGVKSAVWPLSSWLPAAGVAPTPVTALLHAVAVVNAGAFAIMRLTYYCFGAEFLSGTWVQSAVMALAIFTIFYGSSRAVKETHIKRRLAWSTVSNLSYILFGITLMSPAGIVGAMCHFVCHAFMKMCAFLCAGSFMHQTEKSYITDMNGCGKKMPITFGCFAIAAMSLMGVPGFAGFISKWNLTKAAVENGGILACVGVVVLLISALLTAIYMLSVVARAFFPSNKEECTLPGCKDPNWRMCLPLIVCAAATVLLGLFSTPLVTFIERVAAGLM